VRRVVLKGLLAHKLRLLLTALSVVLGVGFVAGTFVLTDTLSHTFDTLFEEASANTDAEVRSTTELEVTTPSGTERDLVPEEILATVRAVEGVAEAEGYVQGDARIVDQDGDVIGGTGAPNFGGSAGGLETLSPFTVEAGRPPEAPDEVMIDAGTAEDHDIGVRDRVRILFPSESREFRVVGLVGFGSADNLAGATFALFETATAQEVLALSVFERTRELGLLRAVGMSRRQLRRMVRWESVIIAVLGAALGLGVGAFFGWAVVSAMDDQGIDQLAFPAGRLALFVVFAGAAGVVAAVFPARRAARLDVLEAIATE